MSEEPIKRQRISEEGDSESVVNYQLSALQARLKDKNSEIDNLRQLLSRANLQLQEANHQTTGMKSQFKMVRHKQLAEDISSLIKHLPTAPTSQIPEEIIARYEKFQDALPEISQYLQVNIKILLSAFTESLLPPSPDALVQKTNDLILNSVKTEALLTEQRAITAGLQEQVENLNRQLQQMQQTNEDIMAEKEVIHNRLVRSKQAQTCKCPCNCGARKVNSITYEELGDVAVYKKEISKLSFQYNTLKQKLAEEQEKVLKLQMELEVSEERFVRTPAFRTLLAEYKSLLSRLQALKEKNDQYQQGADRADETSRVEIQSLVAQEEQRRGELAGNLEKAYAQIAELEREKDELLYADNEKNRQKISLEKNIRELNVLVEDLESDIQRLKKQLAAINKQKSELYVKSEEDLGKRMELQDRISVLEFELREYQTQQQFQASLNLDEGSLQQQLLTQAEEISQLKKQLKKHQDSEQILQERIRKLKRENTNEKDTNEMLINELEVTGKAYEETSKKNKQLVLQLNEMEENRTQLMNDKIKEQYRKSLHDREKGALQERIGAKEEVIQAQSVVIQEQASEIKRLQEYTLQISTKLKDLEERLITFQNNHEEALTKHQELVHQKKSTENALKLAQKKIVQYATESVQFRMQMDYYAKEVLEMQGVVGQLKMQKSSVQSTDESLNEEINRLTVRFSQKFVRCSVCGVRRKDSVIAKCFHSFCRICITRNAENFEQKCPACKAAYDMEDIKTLWQKNKYDC